jgi:hypothetical protein
MIGSAVGGAFAWLVNLAWPAAQLSPGAFALVGMAAVFGSAARATFAFIIFAFELTRDYDAVLPLMLACVVADVIARRFMENSIMTEKLARRGLRVHAEYEADILKQVSVGEVMERLDAGAERASDGDEAMTCTAGETVHDALEIMVLTGMDRVPVVGTEDRSRIVGYLTRKGVLAARERRIREERERESGWFSRMTFSGRGSRESA